MEYKGYTLKTATEAFFKNYINFSGRATLSAFWMWAIVQVIAYIVAIVLDGALELQLFYPIVLFGFMIPNFALLFRRLHDTGRSGWHWLWNLLPLVGPFVLLIFCCQDSQKGTNAYGPSEKYPQA